MSSQEPPLDPHVPHRVPARRGIRTLGLVALLSMASAGIAEEQASLDEEPLAADLRGCALDLLQSPSVHSVSIGVYRTGQIATAHFGELDPGAGNAPTDDTIYAVASITKTMTGYLAAKAVLDGALDLEDDVREHIPGDYPGLAYEGEPIRVRHLLDHSSGLPAELIGIERFLQAGDIAGALEFAGRYDKQDFFADLRAFELERAPGSAYLYSSNGTNLMGYLLESAYGEPYEDLLEKHVLAPAGMRDSAFVLSEKDRARLSNGYDGNGNKTPEQPRFLLGADGYLKSTLGDLTRYMQFQLGDNPIAQESRREISQRGAPMGYFWQIEKLADTTFVKHAGTAIGTTTWVLLCPEEDLGIALVISSRFPGSNDLLYGAAVKLFELLRS